MDHYLYLPYTIKDFIPFLEKKISRIEKVMTAFSILEKMFLKIESLMCALRAHINRTLL